MLPPHAVQSSCCGCLICRFSSIGLGLTFPSQKDGPNPWDPKNADELASFFEVICCDAGCRRVSGR
jgi:hypothetical protein